MKKVILLTLYVIVNVSTTFAQCTVLYSFAASSETVSFSNLSNGPNAHYFWNFGDGTGSNLQNPVHAFPETGKYLVTLFAKDTVSNCATFYESRLNIIKLSNDICQPDSILDSISTNGSTQGLYLNLIDNSSINCNSYSKWCDAGVSSIMQSPAWLGIFNNPARYVGRIRYSSVQNRAVYKTIPYRYGSAKNYNNCSANFEFKTVSQDVNGERILFTAMNKTAASYKWYNFSSASTITPTSDTLSFYFPYSSYGNQLVMVLLQTTGSTGCKDTLTQIIRIKNVQTTTGILEHTRDNFVLNIYPNPAQNTIVVNSEIETERMILINSLGQEVIVLNKPLLKQEIDLSHLSPGIYFLKAENKQGQGVFKVVKE